MLHHDEWQGINHAHNNEKTTCTRWEDGEMKS